MDSLEWMKGLCINKKYRTAKTSKPLNGLTEDIESSVKNTNEYVCDMILLKDLILYLNDREQAAALQDSYND